MEMPDPKFELWCYILGAPNPFILPALSTLRLSLVKNLIKEDSADNARGVDAQDLTLWRVRYFLVIHSDVMDNTTLA